MIARPQALTLDEVHGYVNRLRVETIGQPHWLIGKQAFEYGEETVRVVAVLKVIRAAQGLTALETLLRAGLFIDFGAAIRCLYDAVAEAYFLMEEYPRSSPNVERFVKSFFDSHINGYLDAKNTVPSQKIRAAYVRCIAGGPHERARVSAERIFKTFSGYIHANYAHIMEIYNGGEDDFYLRGVPSVEQRAKRWPQIDYAADAVLHAAAFIAKKIGMTEFYKELVPVLIENDRRLHSQT
ncbi:MAG: hypothetical protein KIT25_06410 [Enhydrobacter sp.]|nr:MAG: hypothetical protein KIT25_06410 [Enhydrobacter sp.]